MTRDFIVATVISVPSTVSVTVLWAATAKPPANVERQQRDEDQRPQMRRARLMKFV